MFCWWCGPGRPVGCLFWPVQVTVVIIDRCRAARGMSQPITAEVQWDCSGLKLITAVSWALWLNVSAEIPWDCRSLCHTISAPFFLHFWSLQIFFFFKDSFKMISSSPFLLLLLSGWGLLSFVSGSPAVEEAYEAVVSIVSPGQQYLTGESLHSLFNTLEHRVHCGEVPCEKVSFIRLKLQPSWRALSRVRRKKVEVQKLLRKW